MTTQIAVLCHVGGETCGGTLVFCCVFIHGYFYAFMCRYLSLISFFIVYGDLVVQSGRN